MDWQLERRGSEEAADYLVEWAEWSVEMQIELAAWEVAYRVGMEGALRLRWEESHCTRSDLN